VPDVPDSDDPIAWLKRVTEPLKGASAEELLFPQHFDWPSLCKQLAEAPPDGAPPDEAYVRAVRQLRRLSQILQEILQTESDLPSGQQPAARVIRKWTDTPDDPSWPATAQWIKQPRIDGLGLLRGQLSISELEQGVARIVIADLPRGFSLNLGSVPFSDSSIRFVFDLRLLPLAPTPVPADLVRVVVSLSPQAELSAQIASALTAGWDVFDIVEALLAKNVPPEQVQAAVAKLPHGLVGQISQALEQARKQWLAAQSDPSVCLPGAHIWEAIRDGVAQATGSQKPTWIGGHEAARKKRR